MVLDLEKKKKETAQYPEKAKVAQEALEEKEEILEAAVDVVPASSGKNAVSEEKNELQKEEPPQIEGKPLSSSENNGKKLFLLGFVVFIGTIMLASGIVILFVKSDQNIKKETVVIEKKITPIPDPKPTVASLQREEWELAVLNGSRVAGLAKKIASQLEDAGYVIKSIGNASKSNYTTTQISISVAKSASEAAAFLLDMKRKLGVGTSSSELTAKFDAQIIVGTDNAE